MSLSVIFLVLNSKISNIYILNEKILDLKIEYIDIKSKQSQ